MKKWLIIICLLLVGCSTKDKIRGLTMTINLEAMENVVWRCQSDNEEIIKVSEENFIEDKNNELEGQYQFKFVGVSAGETTVICKYIDTNNEIELVNTINVSVDSNKFIKYLGKEGSNVEEIPDPSFR